LTADASAAHVRPSPDTTDDPRLMLPINEVSVLTGVSVALLKREHLAGKVPARRLGVLWLIPRAWVDAFTAWPPRDEEVTS
jgi:hypothetical protein